MTQPGPPINPQGPLAPVADGFLAKLTAAGYVSTGLSGQRALFAHLDRWMGDARLGIADLTPQVLERFLQARIAEGYVTKLTMRGLAPLTNYLEHLGLLPRPVRTLGAVDRILGRFQRHLLNERGLGEETAGNYHRVARQFLATLTEPLDTSLAHLTADEVTGFVLARSDQVGVCGMQTVVGGMRALLRFLHRAGLTDRALATAVPSVSRRRQDLPRALPQDQVEQLLQGCDRTKPVGIRDFAILTMLARLGLRANEVAALHLDDIDWAAGVVRIRGKGPRVDHLPLPTDVGEALVAYLQNGRPDCADRAVFIRSCAPRTSLSRQAIGGLVRGASVRAGLRAHGPHRLRHTVATQLQHEGAPLAEIAQLLRHQSIQTTTIYARVDQRALSLLAQPWPGAVQ